MLTLDLNRVYKANINRYDMNGPLISLTTNVEKLLHSGDIPCIDTY